MRARMHARDVGMWARKHQDTLAREHINMQGT